MAIWLKKGAIPRAAMAFIWDGTGTREPRDRWVHCLNPGQVYNDHDARYDLPDDGSQCGPRHPHVEAEDKQRVQYGIEDGARESTHHGKTGTAVCADQVGAACGQDKEWKSKGRDAGIGQ